MWVAPFRLIIRVDGASSQILSVKIGRPTSEWHNFYIWTLLDALLASLEISLWVEQHEKVHAKEVKFEPKKTSFHASKHS